MEENQEKKEKETKDEEKVEKMEEVKEESKDDKKNKKKERFKPIKIIWKIIKTLLIIVLFLVFLVIAVQRITNNRVTVGGYGIYTIVSESMVPEYHVWDMLVAKEINPADIQVGDDVVYMGAVDDFNGRIVTHRVIKRRYDGEKYAFTTKGIANDIEDPEITEGQVFGKVIFKSTILSTISKIINTTYGFYFIIFVPFVIIVTLEVIDTVNEREKLKRN